MTVRAPTPGMHGECAARHAVDASRKAQSSELCRPSLPPHDHQLRPFVCCCGCASSVLKHSHIYTCTHHTHTHIHAHTHTRTCAREHTHNCIQSETVLALPTHRWSKRPDYPALRQVCESQVPMRASIDTFASLVASYPKLGEVSRSLVGQAKQQQL